MVVFALLQGLAEALAQGQVTLSGGAVQELLDLIGAGSQLQGLGGSAGGGLGWCRRQQGQLKVGTEKWVPKLGATYPSPQPQSACPQGLGRLIDPGPADSAAPSVKQGEPASQSSQSHSADARQQLPAASQWA